MKIKNMENIYQESRHISIALQILTVHSYEGDFIWPRTWKLWIQSPEFSPLHPGTA